MGKSLIGVYKMGTQLETESPFIVCMYHNDHYPKGNEQLGPDLEKYPRALGSDFSGKDGFSMYHGHVVPGFPTHPHRGFETVTVVLKGVVDHFDSVGSHGRYSSGDVQWLTTGSGCQHSEMFPLVEKDKPNDLELFQIWLNLPSKSKFVEPNYKMLWQEDIPHIETTDEQGNSVRIKLISGQYDNKKSLKPTPDSWAAEANNHVGIMLIEMDPNSSFTLEGVSKTMNRNLYFYSGEGSIHLEGEMIEPRSRIKVSGNEAIQITNGHSNSYLLVLEGEPIDEPMVAYGPFVMNTKEEISKAYEDYRSTQFGGWPWDNTSITHERNSPRFAKYSDGKEDYPKKH